MTFDMADRLIEDLGRRTAELQALDRPVPSAVASTERAFAH